MRVCEIKQKSTWRFDRENFRNQVEQHCAKGWKQFKKIIHSHLFFHLFFLAALASETIAFFFFLFFLFSSSLIAFSLAALVLTGFSYLILIFYFQTKKPEQFFALRNWFMLLCKKGLPTTIDSSEYHLCLANAAYSFATYLGHQKPLYAHSYFKKNRPLSFLTEKISQLYQRRDTHKMKEILILVSINEHLQLIKENPTHLETHASLANAYVALSHLYRPQEKSDCLPKDAPEKFKAATQKALQQFQIIDHYSPNDPWVYAQLASCYHDLKLYEKEIQAYEAILKLCPNDKEILFRLGILYFQQGLNAQGLQVYEKLKRLKFSRIQELIDFYGANISEEYYISAL